MKFKKRLLILFFTLIILPINTLAYSKYLVPGGENLGINIKSQGILVVGFYDANVKNDLQIGDVIVSINDNEISSINEMLEYVKTDSPTLSLKIGYKRLGNLYSTNLVLSRDENNVYKTGMYVKDSVTGIGTLTFIDPTTNLYGALGHSITDSKTNIKFDIKNGKIFKALVSSIDKSLDGKTGEKNAKFYFDTNYGTIEKNLDTGIFGTYEKDYDKDNTLMVASISEIELGSAYIKTTLDDNVVKDYKIEIIDIDSGNPTKNILFKVTDNELLEKTGGIVKGMSGSPIIQNDKIIGAVTHTVISDNTKGYGISIIKMLESIK
ncbi:MAG: stage IV sporulation protein B [Bacilli bacterium]|nr:stage IV sporulation protein B [Bacilli bacterium]